MNPGCQISDRENRDHSLEEPDGCRFKGLTYPSNYESGNLARCGRGSRKLGSFQPFLACGVYPIAAFSARG